jgi:phosphoribosylglycinamide formyltransferase-1
MLRRITVLISGRGSNLEALLAAAAAGRVAGAVTHVISNNPDARGLALAQSYGIATSVVDHRTYAERAAFDRALAGVVESGAPDLVVLAGFMRVLDAAFVGAFEGRLLNIHPSLLPLYPGLHTHRRALADGVKVHGCTVHYVTATVDGGPIVAQGVVPVLPGDDEDTLAARVLAVEHRLLPAAVDWHCRGEIALEHGRVRYRGATADPAAALLSPAPSQAPTHGVEPTRPGAALR